MTTADPHRQLLDSFQRPINYLRVSVTDRCNLRCRYCMTSQTRWMPKGQILTLEEIHRLVRVAVAMGITKIRLTGGEPLCRKGILQLIARVSRLKGLEDLALTTNGTLLVQKARQLKQAGLHRVNISLDTTDAAEYLRMTGMDLLNVVWQGIQAAAAAGLEPVKINTVVMRGCNDHQIELLADLALQHPYHIRFIEYMPMGIDPREAQKHFISVAEIESRLQRMGRLIPIARRDRDGPATRYRFEGAPGEIGLIGSMSKHFCSRCNRLRLTADGHLRPCLLSDDQFDVITPLRQGASDADLEALFAQALSHKRQEHRLRFDGDCRLRTKMVNIGG
ncbi:MAG: GTP 3',8-cyclase MoaA [Desulfobacteraceae bacterium]|nr:MAG: GTP 3',8-cyclase MoaA [Desulfobacteraceae bacterium]